MSIFSWLTYRDETVGPPIMNPIEVLIIVVVVAWIVGYMEIAIWARKVLSSSSASQDQDEDEKKGGAVR